MKDFDLSNEKSTSDCSENDAFQTRENLAKKVEKSPNSINCSQEIIEIKDEFGHVMKDFDLSNASSTLDCSENDALPTGNPAKEEEKRPNSINCSVCNENFENMRSLKLHGKKIHQAKVPILTECHFGKMKLWRVEHFWTYFFFTFGRDY